MAIYSLEETMLRIDAAVPSSKIAVFRSNMHGKLRSYFDSTYKTRLDIKRGHGAYIGSYSREDNKDVVKSVLKGYLK